MEEGVDILVTTLDRLQRNRDKEKIFLSNVQSLVIDEFDTMLDAGYDKELTKLIEQVLSAGEALKEDFDGLTGV